MKKLMKSMDGNTAAAYIAYAFTDVAAIYPITPSTPMAEHIDEWASNNKKNIFGDNVLVTELQSEAGAAGTVHGSLSAGALTTTFTASQGLLLMLPNMYKISGELLPAVFHVAARALSSHALSIFGDHQDVMAARSTGFAQLASGSVQETMDLGSIAHLSAIEGKVPFIHFFDGFRTSHEIQKIEVIEYEKLEKLINYKALNEFRKNALNPNKPKTMGTAQNPDIYFQNMEASNKYYDNIPGIVEKYMDKINEITGRSYGLFNYYGDENADRIIIAMGSVTEALEETVDYLNKEGEKVGIIKVHLFRPFSTKHLINCIPKTVKKIAVLDRTKEKGSVGQPLYLDIKSALYELENRPKIVGGIYGLGSKDTTPSDLKVVFDNLKLEKPKNDFTIGIVDDLTYKSLEVKEKIDTQSDSVVSCKLWGFGSDGTVGASKNAIKIIGDNSDKYVQAYFSYDSKKSGGVTISNLRFSNNKIRSTYLVKDTDFVSCSKQSYIYKYDILNGLKHGGTFLLNTNWSEDELDDKLPNKVKKYIFDNKINFYTIDASTIAQKLGLKEKTNIIMQSAFFNLTNVIPIDVSIKCLKESIKNSYGKKGETIVENNISAIKLGISEINKISIKDTWKNEELDDLITEKKENVHPFIKNILSVMNSQNGDILPVSMFEKYANGEIPMGTAAYEKRGVALNIPEWHSETCIQCNQCSIVCPHAAIRPFILNNYEIENAPQGFNTINAVGKGANELKYRIQVSPYDCTGCNNCVDVCPTSVKSLTMESFEEQVIEQKPNWIYANDTVGYKDEIFDRNTVKGSQFNQPLLEFSGACAGCGETPYAKLVTQLFGERMMIANATGCSSIWGGSSPSSPYCTKKDGTGPAWASSLFEDNAEFGYGMSMAIKNKRIRIENLMKEFVDLGHDNGYKLLFEEWIENKDDAKISKKLTNSILLNKNRKVNDKKGQEILNNIIELSDFLIKRSVWIFGGDGWAYDIGYGGLDHVLASGEDVNVLVMDTEIYSNTGGQSSKATPTAAVAKFAASGKKIRKKDLGLMQTVYGYVYVAQVALGANKNQLIKALIEAESYKGPSLIIAYAPCIDHGIKGGLTHTPSRQKEAVDSGYWHLWRYDPRRKEQNKNPFQLDSKEPSKPFRDFIMNEVRYSSLSKSFPEIAEEMYEIAEENAKSRLENYKSLNESLI